jgi:cupin 2 domain-containing protein
MRTRPDNLFQGLQVPEVGEVFDTLLCRGPVRIERILSSAEPDPVLYDQPQDEWVLLLEGHATLWVAGEALELGPGDHLFIPARTPHRVVRTSREPPCLWLAVHILPAGG